MSDRFEACLALTLQWEGGFSADPRDPGGATCHGITLNTYRAWADNPHFGVADIQQIPPDTVRAIYATNYWNATRSDLLAPGVDVMVFDEGVNAGCGRSIRLLQEALGFAPAAVDGIIGPQTIARAAAADPHVLISALADRQLAFYQSLTDFATFGDGWTTRVRNRLAAASAA